MISHYLLVALGGALGAVTRLGLGRLIPDTLWHIPFPILLINVLGCFLMGIISALMTFYGSTSDHLRTFLMPGFLGGFTTFSAFALDVGLLWERGEMGHAFLYAGASLVLSLTAFFLGVFIIRSLN